MGLLSFIGMIFLFVGISRLMTTTIHPPKPRRPQRPSIISDTERVNYNWQLNSITGSYNFSTNVVINLENVKAAREAYINEKTFHHSDNESFEVAKMQIFHSEWGIESYEIEQIVEYIKKARNEKFLSEIETINMILEFVHDPNIKYEYDNKSTGYTEYFRFPIETLYDRMGDCDCKAILAATILYALGFDVAFLLMPGHAAIAISSNRVIQATNVIYNGKRWYYCETTGQFWKAGQIPKGISWRKIKLYELS